MTYRNVGRETIEGMRRTVRTKRARRALGFLTLVLAVTFPACGGGGDGGYSTPVSPTPDPPPFVVTITTPATAISILRDDGTWGCNFTATALASGGIATDYAIWDEVELELRYPNESIWTTAKFCRAHGCQKDIVEYWGSDRINYVASATSGHWGYLTNVPQKNMTFRAGYRWVLPSGQIQSVTKWIQCE